MKDSIVKFRYIAVIILVSIHFWSFSFVSEFAFAVLDMFLILTMVAIIIYNKLSLHRKSSGIFGWNIWLFLLLPMVSGIGALMYHGQSFWYSFLALKVNFYWLLYFVLHIYNINIKKLISLMLVIGIVWAILNIVQQVTYPNYWFYSRNEDDGKSLLRAGVYRFMPFRHQYGFFAVLYFFYQYLVHKKRNYFIWTFVCLAGFYFFGTRQYLAATIFCMGIMLLTQEKGRRIFAIFILLMMVSVAFYFQDIIFGKFIKISQQDLNEDNIRLLSYNFYLYDYWPKDWFAKVIGNGKNNSALGRYAADMAYYEGELGMYRSDVGLVGIYNKYGLLYVAGIILYNLKGMRRKYYTDSTIYLRLIFLGTLILFPLSIYYDIASAIPFYCIITYIVDKVYIMKLAETHNYSTRK